MFLIIYLNEKDLLLLLNKAIKFLQDNKILIKFNVESKKYLVKIANGDGRFILNSINSLVQVGITSVTLQNLQQVLQKHFIL